MCLLDGVARVCHFSVLLAAKHVKQCFGRFVKSTIPPARGSQAALGRRATGRSGESAFKLSYYGSDCCNYFLRRLKDPVLFELHKGFESVGSERVRPPKSA